MIKSPLRYPGGKSKVIKQIIEYLPEPENFSEYREPFVGGGSLFIYLKQKYPHLQIWINDLNYELFCLWKIAQTQLEQLVKEVYYLKYSYKNGKLLFADLTKVDVDKLSELQRAVRFFVLNRITFSGTVESGGFSQQAFQKRFTVSSIERLEKLKNILENVKITNLDYSEVLKSANDQIFVFLDPPYLTATKSKLYGKNGDLHTLFAHKNFANLMQKCFSPWLITYDDSPEIRDHFHFANIYPWQVQYGMNNYQKDNAALGKELFISNYKVEKDFQLSRQLSLF